MRNIDAQCDYPQGDHDSSFYDYGCCDVCGKWQDG